MTLTYGHLSPLDILAKAKRDLARLEEAERTGHHESMADALFDLSVTLTSLKDWLKEHPGKSYSRSDVENYMLGSASISALRDVANAGKHRIITHYMPSVTDVASSATASVDTRLGTSGRQPQKLKIIRNDGTRIRASELAHVGIAEWEQFMLRHGIVQ